MIEFQDFNFDWDEAKNKANIEKHKVSFYEAMTVFADENALIIDDDEHSENEDRFVIIGLSANLRLLVVCHCYRETETVIRLISARKANKKEENMYGG